MDTFKQSERSPLGFAGMVGGPTVGDISQGLYQTSRAFSGTEKVPGKGLARFGLQQIPVLGSMLANTITPTEAQQAGNNAGTLDYGFKGAEKLYGNVNYKK
jgi:hypothetical protein